MLFCKLMAIRLWCEDDGFVVSLEMVLITILLVIGLVPGLQVLRDAIIQELSDLATAIGALNTSFAFTASPASTNFVTSSSITPTVNSTGSNFLLLGQTP